MRFVPFRRGKPGVVREGRDFAERFVTETLQDSRASGGISWLGDHRRQRASPPPAEMASALAKDVLTTLTGPEGKPTHGLPRQVGHRVRRS
jgi:hypothetical protein